MHGRVWARRVWPARSRRGRSDMARESVASRLYRGEISYDFIGHRKVWYGASLALIVLSLASMLIRGLHPSIDFKGGNVFEFPQNGHSLQDAPDVFPSHVVTS